MTTDVIDLAAVLTPVAQPRILEGVYRDDEYERMFNVVKREGPWKGIIANHFETVDEVMATVTGNIPPDHGLTLDDVATAHFRGFFAKNSVCFYPELEDVFYNSRFLAEVRDYWGAQYARPRSCCSISAVLTTPVSLPISTPSPSAECGSRTHRSGCRT